MSQIKNNQLLRLLIVEDNIDIAENIADYMESLGYRIDFAANGVSGLHLALELKYDVIILDVMLPAMDGLTFCRELRNKDQKHTPVLILTARGTLDDKLAGFDAGTDDYLVKPFELLELAARVNALVHRTTGKTIAKLRIADLELDTGSMKVKRAGVPIELNRTCLKILTILMQAYPDLVERGELEYALWGDMLPGTDALRSHIYTLRRLIDKPFDIPLLRTVHGIGHRLADDDEIPPQS